MSPHRLQSSLSFLISMAAGCAPDEEPRTFAESCEAYSRTYHQCYPGYATPIECADEQELFDSYASGCSSAVAEYYACLSQLSCEDFVAREACLAEEHAHVEICGGAGKPT